MYSYTALQWIMFFFIYCFFGWIWESCYVSVQKKRWVNRGFLHLPMLPLYGSGAVMMLFVSLPVMDNLFLVYLAGVIAATALELVVGLGMEALFKVKYWDYSKDKFNYKGVICLKSSLFWGVLTLFLTEIAQVPLEKLVCGMPYVLLVILTAVIGAAFLYDTYISTKAALDLAKVLAAMEKAKEEAALQLKALEEKAENMAGSVSQRFETTKEELAKDYRERREALVRSSQEKIGELLEKAHTVSKGMVKRNPTLTSRRYGESIHKLHNKAAALREKGKRKSYRK